MRTCQNAVAVLERKRQRGKLRPRWRSSARRDLAVLIGLLEKFHHAEAGQDVLEYALLLGVVATTALAGSSSLASVVASALTKVLSKVQTAIS